METLIGIIALVAGFALGAAACTVFYREKLKHAENAVRAQFETERATVTERLRSSEHQLAVLVTERTTTQGELSAARAAITEQSNMRCSAEEKNNRIPELEQTVLKLQHELSGLVEVLQKTAEQKSTAEERASTIPGLQEELAKREEDLNQAKTSNTQLTAALAETRMALEKEQQAATEKLALLDDSKKKLSDAFHALSSEALQKNNASFLELAKSALENFQTQAKGDLDKRQVAINELVKPVRESLEKFDGKLGLLEKEREGAYKGLTEQVQMLLQTQHQLRAETGNLVKALRTPNVRGRWGEIQLKRVVEMAGMVEHCHFVQQESATTEEGRLRPDMVVKLPAGKNILIDAKCPLDAYLKAIEAPDEVSRKAGLAGHAAQIQTHIKQLGRKAYWEEFQPSPEFVVLFLPNESFFGAALEADPTLIEIGVAEKVILATPTTLIAILRAVHYGWRQEKLTANARDISKLGMDLYHRVTVVSDHWAKMGRSLGNAVDSYNQATNSLESRLLPAARKLKELHAGTDAEIETQLPLEKIPRGLQAPEMIQPDIAGK